MRRAPLPHHIVTFMHKPTLLFTKLYIDVYKCMYCVRLTSKSYVYGLVQQQLLGEVANYENWADALKRQAREVASTRAAPDSSAQQAAPDS